MNYKANSSAEGEIKILVVAYDESAASYAFIRDMIRHVPGGKQLVIFLEEGSNLVQRLGADVNTHAKLVFIELTERIDSRGDWVRDYMHGANLGEELIILYREPWFGNVRSIVRNLEDSESVKVSGSFEVSDVFAFGNILVDKDTVFLNGNWELDDEFPDNYETIVKRNLFNDESADTYSVSIRNFDSNNHFTFMGRSLYKDIVSEITKGHRINQEGVPGQVPKLGHIDLFMTITGLESCGKPIIMLAWPETQWTKLKQEVEDTTYFMDLIKKGFEQRGYTVYKNPIPFIPYTNQPDDNSYWIGYYNNCLVEVTNNTKRIWLPAYHKADHLDSHFLELMDERNKTIWECLGYEVIQIYGGQRVYAKNKGSIHCLTVDIRC